MSRSALSLLCACAISTMAPLSAGAQDAFAGKVMTIVVGYGQGSGYDTNARFVARHLSRFLPGSPTVIVQNMIGAGTLTAANHVANAAPKDGSTLALVARGMGIEKLMGGQNVRFDPLKVNWIGSTSREVSVVLVRSDTNVRTIKDATEREIVVSAIATGTDGVTFPLALNNMLGTKFRPVMGYKSGAEMSLAMLRGETQGRGSYSWGSLKQEHSDLLKQGAFNILVQMSATKAPELSDVPLVTELVKSEEERQILAILLAGQAMAWPIFAPAETPADRVKLLRSAYMDMLRDKEVLAEAAKIGIDIDPVPAEEIQALLAKVYATPTNVVMKARKLAGR